MWCKSNNELVEYLLQQRLIRTPDVIEAFIRVDRDAFLSGLSSGLSYVDSPVSIGCNQTISAPHMVGMMTEILAESGRVESMLEIGTGSGYHFTVAHEALRPGLGVTIEYIENLVKFGKENIYNYFNSSEGQYVLRADGSVPPFKDRSFDVIYATCAVPDSVKLFGEYESILKKDGRLLVPVGDLQMQKLNLYKKKNSGLKLFKNYGYCRFVPLCGKNGF